MIKRLILLGYILSLPACTLVFGSNNDAASPGCRVIVLGRCITGDNTESEAPLHDIGLKSPSVKVDTSKKEATKE